SCCSELDIRTVLTITSADLPQIVLKQLANRMLFHANRQGWCQGELTKWQRKRRSRRAASAGRGRREMCPPSGNIPSRRLRWCRPREHGSGRPARSAKRRFRSACRSGIVADEKQILGYPRANARDT